MIYHVHDDVLCMVLCVVWVVKLLPPHTVLECVTGLETDLPCRLSQRLMPLKLTGRSSSEATMDKMSHFQDLQFSVASLGLLLSSWTVSSTVTDKKACNSVS